MSGIFRPTFRMPRVVQATFGAFSGAASEGGTILAAHLPAEGGVLAPSLRRFVSAAAVNQVPTFGEPVIRVTLQPVAAGGSNAFFDATVGATAHPALFANEQAFGALILRLVLRPVAFDVSDSIFDPAIGGSHLLLPTTLASGQSFFAPALAAVIEPAAVGSTQGFFAAGVAAAVGAPTTANAQLFVTLKLTFRLSSEVYANAAWLYSSTVGQPGTVVAPLVVGDGNIFAPRVEPAQLFEAVGTLSVAGWTPRPARRPRTVATWPNLPQVEAPPWRLMVVTPEVARARVRALLAERRCSEAARRAREAKRRLDRSLEDIVDAEIVRTVVRLVAEEV